MSSFNNIPEDKPATYKQSWALAYKFASELEDEIGIPQKSLAKIIQGTIYYYHKESLATRWEKPIVNISFLKNVVGRTSILISSYRNYTPQI